MWAAATIEAYSLDNPHAQGYLIPYIPDAKMAFVTDLWNPGPPVGDAGQSQHGRDRARASRKGRITPEKFAGGHGAVGNYADLVQAVQQTPASR